MSIPELLSPSGNLDCAVAALEYGADAVYLGMSQFSARADVENFTGEDLNTLIGYAHGLPRPRRVHVAVNTILRNDEIDDALKILELLRDNQVDAVIVQDLGVARLIRKYFPELTMHASTQLAIHNEAGMIAARELGFKRAIPSRELTLNEIRQLADVPGIELEVFVHGTLCYAYSGLCLLSSVLRDSSGNRGECSYFCRNNFKVESCKRHLLDSGCTIMSMKDLALPDMIRQFSSAGVASLKIEGRKKSALWVAAVTNYYRKLLDGSFKEGEREECERHIQSIFSRPWTSFFVQRPNENGITDIRTVGHRGVFCGIVQSVVPGKAGNPDALRFMVKDMTLEKHDGLQVELPKRDKPYGFAIDDIKTYRQGGQDTWQRVFSVAPETNIEVPLPEDHPDLVSGQRIFCSSSQRAKNAYRWPALRPALVRQRRLATFDIKIEQNCITAEGRIPDLPNIAKVSCSLSVPDGLQPAKNPEGTKRAAETAFAKLGDTTLELGELSCSNSGNWFVPVSIMNEVRRLVAEKLEDSIRQNSACHATEARQDIRNWESGVKQQTAKGGLVLKIDHLHYLNLFKPEDFNCVQEIIIDIQQTNVDELLPQLKKLSDQIGYNKIRLALPPIIRGKSLHNWKNVTAELLNNGWRRWEIANLGGEEFLLECGATRGQLNLTADWPMYAGNTSAARQLLDMGYQRITLQPDDENENWLKMIENCGNFADVIIYQDTPLAISAVCANASLNGECVGRENCNFTKMKLTSKKGEELFAINNHCQTVYINREPLNHIGRKFELTARGAKNLKLVFMYQDYSPVMVKRIFDSAKLPD